MFLCLELYSQEGISSTQVQSVYRDVALPSPRKLSEVYILDPPIHLINRHYGKPCSSSTEMSLLLSSASLLIPYHFDRDCNCRFGRFSYQNPACSPQITKFDNSYLFGLFWNFFSLFQMFCWEAIQFPSRRTFAFMLMDAIDCTNHL